MCICVFSDGNERMWCLNKICEFLKSPLRKMLNLQSFPPTDKEDSPLSNLLKALPKLLLKQYEYEDQYVKRGKQLLYSVFFKVSLILWKLAFLERAEKYTRSDRF